MAYRYLDHIATSDIAFESTGKTLEEVFASCAEAMLNVQIDNPEALRVRYALPFHLEDRNPEMLLHRFLEEMLYFKDAEGLLLSVAALRIRRADGVFILDATAEGEKTAPDRHELGVDVKAVTWHRFELKENDGEYTATVVLDV